MAINCAAAEGGVLIKKEKKIHGTTSGLRHTMSGGLKINHFYFVVRP